MKTGIVIKKSSDFNQELFWKLLNDDLLNAPEWIANNYHVVNEDYAYCVARERIKAMADCLSNDLPFRLDAFPEICIDFFEEGEECEDIFEIENCPENKGKDWFEIFGQEDIGREILKVGENGSKLIDFLNKDFFLKTVEKHFSIKNFNTVNVVAFLKAHHDYDMYGKHLYPFEDADVHSGDFFRNPEKYDELLCDLMERTEIEKIGSRGRNSGFLASKIRPFEYENELRCILVGDKIHSISKRDDYKNDIPNRELLTVTRFLKVLTKKYSSKVPFLIWNVDICVVDGRCEIVEGHLNCSLLGHFFGNQDYLKYFKLLEEKI